MHKKIEKLAALLRISVNTFVLTGAGVSTESGIPDFRSPGTGIWEKVNPLQNSTAQVLYSDPERFYRVGFKRFLALKKALPNRTHYALALMEKKGIVKGVITQNIDGLHAAAGTEKLWEIHGLLRTSRCTRCGFSFPWQTLANPVLKDKLPYCSRCTGLLRPDVVLFGDPMPPAFVEAENVLKKGCSLMLVIGSSLEVYPAADLVRFGDKLVIINLQPTPYDNDAELVIHENCGLIMDKLLNILELQD